MRGQVRSSRPPTPRLRHTLYRALCLEHAFAFAPDGRSIFSEVLAPFQAPNGDLILFSLLSVLVSSVYPRLPGAQTAQTKFFAPTSIPAGAPTGGPQLPLIINYPPALSHDINHRTIPKSTPVILGVTQKINLPRQSEILQLKIKSENFE